VDCVQERCRGTCNVKDPMIRLHPLCWLVGTGLLGLVPISQLSPSSHKEVLPLNTHLHLTRSCMEEACRRGG
jgi:hypothetical protein